MQTPQPQDTTTLAYRVTSVERDMQNVKEQFRLYVTQREIELQQREKELQLKNIEQNIEQIRKDQQNSNRQQNDINTKLDKQSEKIDEIQLKTLKYVVNVGVGLIITIIGGVIIGVIIYYATHPGG